jgi:hypothetical protein
LLEATVEVHMNRNHERCQRWTGVALALVAATTAWAQEPAPPQLPLLTRDGTVAQVLVNPDGDADGLLLQDGTLVRFMPHAVADLAPLRVGAVVQTRGEPATTPSGLTLFDAQVTSAGRTVVADAVATPPRLPPPPGGPDSQLRTMTVSGRARLLLTNPDGVVDGLLLEDGTVVHAGPRARLSRLGITPGKAVTVTGVGGAYPQGRSLHAQTIQLANGPIYAVDRLPPPPPPPPAP